MTASARVSNSDIDQIKESMKELVTSEINSATHYLQLISQNESKELQSSLIHKLYCELNKLYREMEAKRLQVTVHKCLLENSLYDKVPPFATTISFKDSFQYSRHTKDLQIRKAKYQQIINNYFVRGAKAITELHLDTLENELTTVSALYTSLCNFNKDSEEFILDHCEVEEQKALIATNKRFLSSIHAEATAKHIINRGKSLKPKADEIAKKKFSSLQHLKEIASNRSTSSTSSNIAEIASSIMEVDSNMDDMTIPLAASTTTAVVVTASDSARKRLSSTINEDNTTSKSSRISTSSSVTNQPSINRSLESQMENAGQICRNFSKGSCRYGNNCHFLHEKPPEQFNRGRTISRSNNH
jgi:hypothetical protein